MISCYSICGAVSHPAYLIFFLYKDLIAVGVKAEALALIVHVLASDHVYFVFLFNHHN